MKPGPALDVFDEYRALSSGRESIDGLYLEALAAIMLSLSTLMQEALAA